MHKNIVVEVSFIETAPFHKANTATPEIVVSLSNTITTVKTNIKYFDIATRGLDPGYDIGNFEGASLDIFTHTC